ncbi:MAG: hypothetical protein IJ300_00870 [Clostridia bacterium]|nr:hypothetical protein [Clostridia bacterium]
MINGNLAYKDEYISRPVRKAGTTRYGNHTGTGYHSGSGKRTAGVYSARQQTVRKPVIAEKNVKTIEKDKREMINRKVTLLRIAYMLIIAFSASFMISKYVAVNETASEIRALSKELENTRAYTSQRVYEMERNIDLSEVEEIATTELGMQRPESYQIIYVNVDKDDLSEVTAKEVEGAGNDLKALFGTIKENIIELFSIN